MYKTVVIDRIKDLKERSFAIETVVNEQENEKWELVSALSTKNDSTILIFKENLQSRINNDINKSISNVKNKINKVVDVIKNKDKSEEE